MNCNSRSKSESHKIIDNVTIRWRPRCREKGVQGLLEKVQRMPCRGFSSQQNSLLILTATLGCFSFCDLKIVHLFVELGDPTRTRPGSYGDVRKHRWYRGTTSTPKTEAAAMWGRWINGEKRRCSKEASFANDLPIGVFPKGKIVQRVLQQCHWVTWG